MIPRTLTLLAFSGVLALCQSPVASQTQSPPAKLRVIAFGAHPDDCDGKFGGTAIKMSKAGHAVKFVSVTNGDAGHQSMGGASLAKRRFLEAQEAARRFGIQEYEILDNHDGELMPSLEVRRQIIRAIRKWKADIVLSPRANDYHPDHRYTGVLVQDAAYMVVVPNIVADTAALDRNPVFLYFSDNFQKPAPFRPDVVVPIDSVWEQKLNAMDAHVSQYYEWLPWVAHNLDQVPKDLKERRLWLGKMRAPRVNEAARKTLIEELGDAGQQVQYVEAFELCEYGRQPKLDELRAMFPIK